MDQKFGNQWWVRLEVVWRKEAQIDVTVEKNPPGPNDFFAEADGLHVVTPEEQIEYASGILSLQAGDIFVCGTCGGVGQGTNTFLNPGDVMETEVEGLGKMRNRFVAEKG